MRLYLSSFRLGTCSHELTSLTGDNKKALIILNACDGMSDDERSQRWVQELRALSSLGYTCEELDLRDYFDVSLSGLEARLQGCGLLWVRGGNVFILNRAMALSGLKLCLIRFLEEDAFVYGGYSAGASILFRDLHGIEVVDPCDEIPPHYPKKVYWAALDVLPFVVVPHYRSQHPESDDVEKLVQYYVDNHCPFITLHDGEVIIKKPEESYQVMGSPLSNLEK